MGNKRSIRYWALGRWICIQMCIASQMSGLKQSLENWKRCNALMEDIMGDMTLQALILIFNSYIPGDISNFTLAIKLGRIFTWIFLTIYKIYHLRRHCARKTSFGPRYLCGCTDLLHLTPRQQFPGKWGEFEPSQSPLPATDFYPRLQLTKGEWHCKYRCNTSLNLFLE